MKNSILFAFVFTFALSVPAVHPQSFSLTANRVPIISLDGLWRFHTGDNPAWADPTYDDSNWPLVRSDESWTKQGFFTYSGYAWYRFAIQVEDGTRPLGLLVPRIYTGYQVYEDGKLLGGSGSIRPTAAPSFAANPRLFQFVPGSPGRQTVQIAIRVWEYRPIVSWVGGGTLQPGNAAGDPALLTQQLDWLATARRHLLVNTYAFGLLATFVGLTILTLFLLHRNEREYLWFSILLLSSAMDAMLNVAGFSDAFPFLLFRLADEVLVAISSVSAILFFSNLLKTRRSSLWWAVSIASALSPLSVAVYYLQWAPVGVAYIIQLSCLLPAYLWIIAALSLSFIRKNQSARLLLLPAALLYGAYILDSVAYISRTLDWGTLPSGHALLLQSPFPIDLLDVVRYVFIFALLMFLVRRFSLARQEETRMSTELAAARSMQAQLIPGNLPDTPGFLVESVYVPASEVGGDFFQVLPAADGSLLIVVGDVSGKGLKAAMTVSTIAGALRHFGHRQPALVLAHLNRVLCGHVGGFVTCAAILISEDGSMIIANAGHLPPYCNGEELPLPSGLPLGLLAETDFEEKHFHLSPGDQLTFLSDGVVEAQSPTGELFGFDRTRQISTQSAEAIAHAAQQFGQEDDITVLTVARVPKLEAVTA